MKQSKNKFWKDSISVLHVSASLHAERHASPTLSEMLRKRSTAASAKQHLEKNRARNNLVAFRQQASIITLVVTDMVTSISGGAASLACHTCAAALMQQEGSKLCIPIAPESLRSLTHAINMRVETGDDVELALMPCNFRPPIV